MILFNQGNITVPPTDRSSTLTNITAVPPAGSAFTTITVPVVGVSFAAGEVLAQPNTTATVAVVNDPQANVIAELDGTNDNNVVMAGGHLDSVQAGPGINDNGSGSSALLETALMLANVKPQNTLRFAWWGGEESGLVGSRAYVAGLSAAELDRIAMYMNYDMVGSPNYIQMVYDANQSSFPAPAGMPIPPGSEAIENFYERYYTGINEPYDDAQFSGRSDYQAFIETASRPVASSPARSTQDRGAADDLGRHDRRRVRPLLPRRVRLVPELQPARARGEQRPDRSRRTDLRLLDRVGERRQGEACPRQVEGEAADAGRAARDVRSVDGA